jgi:hypothetical protein
MLSALQLLSPLLAPLAPPPLGRPDDCAGDCCGIVISFFPNIAASMPAIVQSVDDSGVSGFAHNDWEFELQTDVLVVFVKTIEKLASKNALNRKLRQDDFMMIELAIWCTISYAACFPQVLLGSCTRHVYCFTPWADVRRYESDDCQASMFTGGRRGINPVELERFKILKRFSTDFAVSSYVQTHSLSFLTVMMSGGSMMELGGGQRR